MDWLVIPGVVITLLGVGGLVWCMVRANKLRAAKLEGEPLATELAKLIPVNIASLFLGVVGLAMVLVGRLL